MKNRGASEGHNRIQPDSWLNSRWVPALLLALGIVALALVVFAAGVLLGWVTW